MRHKRGQHLRAVHQRADRPDLCGLPTTPIPVVAGGPAIGWVTGSQSREETRVPYVASAAEDGTARLWNVATGHQITATLIEPDGGVHSVAFSPDGKTLTAATVGDTAQSWNVDYLKDTAQYLCTATRRPFTRTEWAHYVVGPAYIKICP
jgi:WD40 repeat protein